MKCFLTEATLRKNTDAMILLAMYYKNVEKDYMKMKQYYLMAIIRGDTNTLHHLGTLF